MDTSRPISYIHNVIVHVCGIVHNSKGDFLFVKFENCNQSLLFCFLSLSLEKRTYLLDKGKDRFSWLKIAMPLLLGPRLAKLPSARTLPW